MLIILIIILTILAIFFSKKDYALNKGKSCIEQDDKYQCASIICGSCAAVYAVALIIVACFYTQTALTVNDKLDMYEAENKEIEERVDMVAVHYTQYELSAIQLAKMDTETLVMTYPELKNNTVVLKQIDVYTKNNDKIKKLKEEKIDLKPYQFWIYLGGIK